MTRKRTFDGKTLVDAESELMLPILSLDLAAAKAAKENHEVNDPNNFTECVIAQGSCRTFGPDSRVRIMRHTAYISLPGEKNARRYQISDEAYDILSKNDKNEWDGIPVDVMIRLLPPQPGKSLSHMREYSKKWRRRNRKFQGGHSARKTSRKQAAVDPHQGVVRNGIYVRL